MPSFDIVSEVDNQEIDNAINQARKELATRFDLKDAQTEIVSERDKLVLTADDGAHLKALRDIVIGRLCRALRETKQKKLSRPSSHKASKCKANYRTGRFASREKRKMNSRQ